ncbi:MAG: GTPase [Acholeplasma sp.]
MPLNTTKCIGCGVNLQTTNPEQLGYVLNDHQIFCKNCYQLMHYGKAQGHSHPDKLPNFEKDAVIVVVTSLLYLDSILNSEVKRLGDTYKVVYLINQIDLLPDATSKNFLLGKIQKSFRLNRVSYTDIVLMSALNPYDIDHLKTYLKDFNMPNVYLIGLQNSGKTTIFKALTGNKDAISLPKAALTQSMLHATFEDINVYDTPGLYQSGYLHEFFEYKDYKSLLPLKQFKPRNGILKVGQTLMIGGLVNVTVLKGETKSALYVSDMVKHHITQSSNVETILQNESIFKLRFDNYVSKDYKLVENQKYQFTLADFGILHIVGPVTIQITTHPKLHLTLQESFFK